jgi:hypothetical protein
MSKVRLPIYNDEGFTVPGYAEVDLMDLMRVVNVKVVTPKDEASDDEDYDVYKFNTKTRQESEKVLYEMLKLAEVFNTASVADLHDLIGVQTSFLDTKWGWRREDLAKAEIKSVSGGLWTIEFPNPISVHTSTKTL